LQWLASDLGGPSKDAKIVVLLGFNVPDLGVRADIVPGKVARVRLVADKVGTFAFACDIFCGSGHEEMVGSITVTD